MDSYQEHLRTFVNSKSKFLDLKDGQEATVKLLSAEPVTSHYQGDPVQSIRFHFEVDGKEMLWDRTSREFAKQMMEYVIGDVLTIKVSGRKNQTKYFITKVG